MQEKYGKNYWNLMYRKLDKSFWEHQKTNSRLWMGKAETLVYHGRELMNRAWAAHQELARIATQARTDALRLDVPRELSYEMELHEIGSMILGFGIENALKGLLVHRLKFDESVTEEKFIKLILKSHLLAQIAQQHLNLKCSSYEILDLEILTDAITWRGRYPRPANPEKAFARHVLDRPGYERMTELYNRVMTTWQAEGGLNRSN